MATASAFVSSALNVNRLVANLVDAIQSGNVNLSKDLVAQVSKCHPKLDIKISNDENNQQRREKEFSVTVHMEDRETSGTKFELFVKATNSVSDLKRKVWKQHNIPPDVQRWIIGKKIPENTMTLGKCGVSCAGHTIYLYIVLTRPQELEMKSDQSRSDFPDGDGLMSPNTMCNTMSFMEQGKQSDMLLMNSNVNFNTLSNQTLTSTLPSSALELESDASPPPIPDRVPLLDDLVESDSEEQTQVVRTNLLMQVIPAPQQQSMEESKPLGWECPFCTYFNLPTRPGCEICCADRPESYVVPDNYEMTDKEVAMLIHQDELERLTRHDHETALRDNFKEWLKINDLDLVQNTEPFTCPICFDECEPGEGVVLRDCLHQFCRECIQGAVTHSEEPILKCPYQDDVCSCDSVLQEREIRALVPEEMFLKYLQRGLDQAESQAANSFHCKTTDCKGWCLYEDEVNFFVCPICKKENCLTCKVIHEGMNCKEYQADLATKALNDDAAKKTQALIQNMVKNGTAMNCPQCQIIVQKKDGCDWIKCSVCKTEICWVTKGPRWGPKGNGDTSGGCQCGVDRRRCHARCANCH